jgi:hypothetical protein
MLVLLGWRAWLIYCVVALGGCFWLGSDNFSTCTASGGGVGCAITAICNGMYKVAFWLIVTVLGGLVGSFS